MLLRGVFAFCFFVWCGGLTAKAASDLEGRLDKILDGPAFAQAQWGVKVCSLKSGATLFARNADKLLKPASNAKLFTAALALDRLGPDFRIKTSCYATGPLDAKGFVQGDLIVYGRGDPSFSARFHDGDYGKAMQPLLDALSLAGVRGIDGGIVGDDRYFAGPPYGGSWTWDDLENYYGAPASALTYQDNVVDLQFKPGATAGAPCQIVTMPQTSFVTFSNRTRTVAAGESSRFHLYTPLGGDVTYVWGALAANASPVTDAVPVSDPAGWFAAMLKDGLVARGLPVSGSTRSIHCLELEDNPPFNPKWVEIASVQSAPVSEIVKNTLKPSENLYAQLLLLQVGARTVSTTARTTEAAGLVELRRFLADAGVPRGQALLDDGSGLSRSTVVTPNALVQLLTFMSHHRARGAFFDALPIAGVDGTLRRRFRNTPAAGNVHAKTGSLEYVDTLSGYLTNKAGDNLVFSIMLNNYHEEPGNPSGRGAIDSVVRELVNSR